MRLSRHLILFRELFPFTFVVILWVIQLIQAFEQTSWAEYALYPRTVHGLLGIITAPLLHAGFTHLFDNTIPMLVLGLILFNSYKEIAGKIFWLIYILDGCFVWLFARSAFHLGASGVVFGLASFLFFSGIIRRNPRLMVLSLLVVFLYGGMVWEIFPIDQHISWESHLYGALTGAMLAVVFRKEGPQRERYAYEDEEEDDDNDEHKNPPGEPEEKSPLKIVYTFKEKDDDKS